MELTPRVGLSVRMLEDPAAIPSALMHRRGAQFQFPMTRNRSITCSFHFRKTLPRVDEIKGDLAKGREEDNHGSRMGISIDSW
jgi:hypothetical protein